MAYFDDKEDVLGINLTPLGRTLLAQGKLMPAFYTFLDDDVLYDIESSGDTESNYQIKNRILNETPRVRPQTNLQDLNIKNKDLHPDLTNDVVKYNLYPLGTSNDREKESPSWRVNVLNNEIKTAKNYLSSSYGIHDIPQINMEIEYSLSIGNINNVSDQVGLPSSPNLQISTVYADGTFLKIEEEQVILQILERNGFVHGESMKVEAFIYDDAEQEKLIPLKFVKNLNDIQNDIFVGDELPFSDGDPEPNTVEYYFDIRVDKEIPTSDYGKTGTGNALGADGSLNGNQDEEDQRSFDSGVDASNLLLDRGQTSGELSPNGSNLTKQQIQQRSFKSPNIYKSPVTDNEVEDCD